MDKLGQWLQGTVHADKVFREARKSFVADMTGASFEECLHRATVDATAAAVRSFMGSEAAVERACAAAAKMECADYVWPDDFSPTEREADRKAMRAGLSAAIGEDIGGGRG